MNNKNDQGNRKNEKKPIVVKVNAKKVIAKKKGETLPNNNVQRTLDEHMKENREENKKKINITDILVYGVVIIIVGLCIFLIYNLFQKTGDKYYTGSTTTKVSLKTTTTTSTKTIGYKTTTAIATKATHTVYANTTKAVSTKRYTTTTRKTTKPSTTTSTKVTTTTTTSTTEKTTIKVDDTSQESN